MSTSKRSLLRTKLFVHDADKIGMLQFDTARMIADTLCRQAQVVSIYPRPDDDSWSDMRIRALLKGYYDRARDERDASFLGFIREFIMAARQSSLIEVVMRPYGQSHCQMSMNFYGSGGRREKPLFIVTFESDEHARICKPLKRSANMKEPQINTAELLGVD